MNYFEAITEDINREFLYPVNFKECHTDLNEFYDPSRRQYDGNKLVKYLDSLTEPDSLKTIGLFRVDLFIPILTYIFGQAIFKGKTGIVSIYRLKNEQYGLKKDDQLLLDRCRKVVLHELGHTFGLMHCHVPSCVMRSSTYVEDIDQKKPIFCNTCRVELEASSNTKKREK
jgi:archaemetzincin